MRLVSHVGRAIRKSGLNTTEFARESGIARSTLEKLIGGHFSEIRRDTIERIAARLKITDISELFSLQAEEQDFLAPYKARKSVTFLFGTHDVTDAHRSEKTPLRTTVDLWDFRTQAELLSFLRSHEPQLRDELRFYSKAGFGAHERQEVLDLVRRHNTVIVGSPKINPACEAVLCSVFRGGQGYKPRRKDGPRLKLSEGGRLKGSILDAGGSHALGIVDTQEARLVVPCEYKPAGETSQDAGLAYVVYRPLGTAEEVCCVILAGISGCGTYGAARSLVEHPPTQQDLQPGVAHERATQTTYKKPTDSTRDDRQVVKVGTVMAV
ncbi:MAG: helix-turn-helix transcriptional regulator [Planctomycetes bacterium]|nr:helix-turn-helix transcriptional regulator [Planctomycetota bacterium]MCC7169134.1 helix-turn-helix transcriptional regulator [Planctomycetota bacterium]